MHMDMHMCTTSVQKIAFVSRDSSVSDLRSVGVLFVVVLCEWDETTAAQPDGAQRSGRRAHSPIKSLRMKAVLWTEYCSVRCRKL